MTGSGGQGSQTDRGGIDVVRTSYGCLQFDASSIPRLYIGVAIATDNSLGSIDAERGVRVLKCPS